jgi:hypothetical protein
MRLSLSKGEGRVTVHHYMFGKTPHLNPLPSTRGEADPSKLREMSSIRLRSVTGRVFANNADDILPRAKTSVPVRFALPPAD